MDNRGKSLAPTAPVEASGSERDGPEVGEDAVSKILAPYLPLINSTPDLLSILYDADLMPEQTVTVRGAICVAAVCEAHKAALRPQPSGETREAVARLTKDVATIKSFSANIATFYDGPDKRYIRDVAADIEAVLALLSARPLALGGQQGERADRYYEALVQADLKIRSLPGTDQSDVEFIRDALSTTPARAEAQDEGAAVGEVSVLYASGMGGMRHVQWVGGDMPPVGTRLYAHPSPTPAADADRVRETPGAAEAFDAIDVADRLIERAYGDEVPTEWTKTIKGVAKARAALKSTAAKEGGKL